MYKTLLQEGKTYSDEKKRIKINMRKLPTTESIQNLC